MLYIPLSGVMTLAREEARAHKAHIVLDASDKWLAFGRGCVPAAGTLALTVLLIGVWLGIILWRDKHKP